MEVDMPVEPEIELSKELVYDGKLFKVYKERVRLPDGGERPREIVVHPGAVALVVVDDSSRLVLVRQYRRAGRRASWPRPGSRSCASRQDRACRKAWRCKRARYWSRRARQWRLWVLRAPPPAERRRKHPIRRGHGSNTGRFARVRS